MSFRQVAQFLLIFTLYFSYTRKIFTEVIKKKEYERLNSEHHLVFTSRLIHHANICSNEFRYFVHNPIRLKKNVSLPVKPLKFEHRQKDYKDYKNYTMVQ